MRRRRPLSIGAKWTLRYSAAVLVSVSIFSLYIYARVERNVYRDAELLLELQVREIVEELKHRPSDAEHLEDYVNRHIDTGGSRLVLGIAVLDREARVKLARGVLQKRAVPLPAEVLSGEEGDVLQRVAGVKPPLLVLAARTPEGFVQVAMDGRRITRTIAHLRNVFLMSLPVVLLLTGGLGWLLARGSLRPIAHMTATARRITATNLDQMIPTTGSGDQLDQLAATLNDMLARMRESMDRMRQFSVDAAHQLRTPLAALRSQLEVTLEKPRTPEEYQRVLGELLVEVELLADAVHSMLRLASSQAGIEPSRFTPVALVPLLETVLGFFEPVAKESGVSLVRDDLADVCVPGDPSWLHQLFANLLHNAIKYTPQGGCVRLGARAAEERVGVYVQDTGLGLDAHEIPKIFERFHRVGARQAVPGAGLGLPIAREIARAHGGSIELESRPGAGSTFTVWLPVSPKQPTRQLTMR